MAELVTTGHGEVERTADQAGVALRYASRSKERTAAVQGLTRRMATVEPIVTRPGVVVRSRRLSVHDVWEGKRRSGAEATQSYALLVTDVSVLNDLLGELVTTEPAHLDGPHWELADRTAAHREAQRDAVADGRASAQGYADALGARLGPLLRLEDTSPGRLRETFHTMALSSGSGPAIAELSLEPQLVTVVALCSLTWALLD
jgi:uncharacterized protein YggE